MHCNRMEKKEVNFKKIVYKVNVSTWILDRKPNVKLVVSLEKSNQFNTGFYLYQTFYAI